jgi:hypothetical protein
MDTSSLQTKFARMGARIKVADRPSRRRRVDSGVISLDVGKDRDGEYFRKNTAYRRQGEWFFLPEHGMRVDESLVLRDEPLRRGSVGKPHWVERCYRTGGENVYVCPRHPNGVSANEHRLILTANPAAKGWGWRLMRRNAGVFVRGRVRHADHKTIVLPGWHRVLLNTESNAEAMRNVAFLD